MTQAATTTDKSKKNLPPPSDLPTETLGATAIAASDGFQKVELDRPTFKAELFLSKKPGSLVEIYEGPPCQGYVVGHVEMPEMLDPQTGELRAWFCYVIELTAPTKAVDRDVQKDMRVGEQVLVAETAQIKQAIPVAVANHPTHMLHVKIVPVERKPLPDDATKRMWKTDVHVHPVPVPRKKASSGNSVIASMLASAKTAQIGG